MPEIKLAKHQVKIGGMQCSFCSENIRKALMQLEGIGKVSVSLAHEEVLVHYDPVKVKPWKINETLRKIGYTVRDPRKMRTFEDENIELARELKRLLTASMLTFITGSLMFAMWLGYAKPWFPFVMMSISLVSVFMLGYPFLRMAFHSLKRRILNQHVLMELGAFGGLIGGFAGFFMPQFASARVDFFAVATFITAYHILGGYASLRVRTKSSQAVKKLLSLQPPTARVIRNGKELIVKIEEVEKGELVRIRPGESIPVDGVVVAGYSTVDESIVTGEPLPMEKTIGSQTIAGSVNLTGTLKVKVTRIGEESFLRQVVRYVEEARAMKPGILQLIDLILKYFVQGVLLFAFAGFLAWSLGAWLILGQSNIPRAAFASLAVFVMGYPCALGMATPLAIIRGGEMAAVKGILFRSAEAFHIFKDVKKIVFDKTGTITYGKPKVVHLKRLSTSTETELLQIAASIESVSEHPLGRAIIEKALEKGVKPKEAANFQNVLGKGVKGTVSGKLVYLGKLRFLAENGIEISSALKIAKKMEEHGETVVGVAYDGKLLGLIGIADQIKEDALETMAELRELGIEPIILTGDNARTAKAVAGKIGVKYVIAEVLPNEKADVIRKLQENKQRVVMVGDGINDSPALMQADIGIALGARTDIAIESADVIVVGDKLSAVLDAFYIGRNSYNKTKQNLALAFLFNGVGVPLAATGLIHPVWAMVAMGFSVAAVLLNSFGRQLIPKAERKETQIQQLTLEVPSIRCESCIASIIDAISRLKGVISINGDFKTKQITIKYQGSSKLKEQIKREIIKRGHIVS